MPINVLSQETINKIAAGEIIERPLNIVKELVENSLDAFASSVNIEIDKSGKKLIRVSDDGFGMDRKDLELSILSHTTSKIQNFNDLLYIHSLGFRGEALASIAAISSFEIKTMKKGETLGWKLSSYGGKDVRIIPWAGAEGSIVEVKKLFFNTPARHKFLKSDSMERLKIIGLLEETALANHDVYFKVFSKDKTIFFTSKTNDKVKRITDILGKNFAMTLENVQINRPRISLDIYFTGKNNSLSSRKYQFLFVNSRPINYPKWLTHCVYRAYKESIPHNSHPGILIYITIDSSEIDVNVHPTKREIKFADENCIYNIIYNALNNAVGSYSCPKIPINLSEANISTKQDEFISEKFDDNIKILGQVFETYIVIENRSNLYIFDQHAVAERIKYELYLTQMKTQSIKIQQMLMPENFYFSSSVSEFLKTNIPLINKLGINIEEFGQKSFRVTEYPALLGDISIKHIVEAIIEDIENNKNIEIEQKSDMIIRSACRASIKSKDNISIIEIKKLISDLFKCEHPFTCPHGRPTTYKMSLNDLERFFNRK